MIIIAIQKKFKSTKISYDIKEIKNTIKPYPVTKTV